MNKKICIIIFACLLTVCFGMKQGENSKVTATESLVQKGYHEIDGKRYYYDSKGNSIRALFDYKNKTMFLYGDGRYAKNRFFTKNGNTYVFNSKGYMVKDKLYNASHIKKRETYFVYCNKDGIIQEGIQEIDGNLYYMDLNAEYGYRTGLQKINDDLYYFHEDGSAAKYQIIVIDNKTYFFNDEGKAVKGYLKTKINAKTKYFYFDEDGVSQTGLLNLPGQKNKRYFNGDGTIKRNEFVTVDGNTYFLMNDGFVCRTNWRNIGKEDLNQDKFFIHCDEEGVIQQGITYVTRNGYTELYYLDLNSEKGYRTGIQKVNDTLYGFSLSSGKGLTGLKTLNNKIYYFNDKSEGYTSGFLKIDDKTYYFNEEGEAYVNQLITINDNPYFFTNDGSMATGYKNITINKQKHYFFYDENGISQKGLIDVPGTSYARYFNGDGTVVTSEFKRIDDKLYFFTSSGIKFIGNWRNAGKHDLKLDYDLYIHSDENGVIAEGYTEFVRDGIDVVYYFDRDVKFGHRLGLVDCGDKGTYYFLKSKTYGSVAKGLYSDPTVKKTYAFDEVTGQLQTSGELNIAGTNLTYKVNHDGTLDLNKPILEIDDLKTKFVKLGLTQLYKGYGHDSFSMMEFKELDEITNYSCSGLVIKLLFELYDKFDYFERNHDLMWQAYTKRENGEDIKIWSKEYPIENLQAGDLVVINKYDCYDDTDDIGDLSTIDINGDGICDRQHEPFMGDDSKLIDLHVHHVGIYLGDGYYLNSIPSRGVCIQKLPEKTETIEISAFARVLDAIYVPGEGGY